MPLQDAQEHRIDDVVMVKKEDTDVDDVNNSR